MDVRALVLGLWLAATASFGAEVPVLVQLVVNPPYAFAPASGSDEPTGFIPEVFKLLKVGGYRWELQIKPWARILVDTEGDKSGLVLLPTLSRTPEREARFAWVAEVASPRYFFLGRPGVAPAHAPGELRDRTIAVLRGNTSDDWLKRNGFRSVIQVTNLDQMVKLVMRGRADYLLKDLTSLQFFLESNGLEKGALVLGPLVPELAVPLFMAGSVALEPRLAQGLRAELARLKASGELDRLWARWQ